MSLIKTDCIEFRDKRAKCVAQQKGRKFTLINNSGHLISKVKIDGCVIKEERTKCDYLFKVEAASNARALFVELKGGGLNDAMKQILSTIDYLKDELHGWRLDARIVSSGNVPDLKSFPNYRELNRAVRKTGGDIDRKTLYYNETC